MPEMAMRNPNNLLMSRPDGTFCEASVAAGIATIHRARRATLLNMSAGWRVNFLGFDRRAPLELWENVTPGIGNWLAIIALHDPPNRFAVGDRVELRTATSCVRTQEITVGANHAEGQAGPLHFALGSADRADLRVIWPDDTATDWARVTTDRAITLRR